MEPAHEVLEPDPLMTQQDSLPIPARERGRVAPVRLAHVVMRTSRYRERVAWYKTVLEAEMTYSNGMLARLAARRRRQA